VASPIQITRYDRLIRRATGVVGEGAIVTNVLPDVFPTVDLENTTIELKTLSGWLPGQMATSQAGVAAMINRSQVFNPAGSGKLVVVEDAFLATVAGGLVNFGLSITALTALTSNFWSRDTRSPTTTRLVAQARTQTGGSPPVASGRIVVEAGTSYHLTSRSGLAVLAPGTGFEFADSILNNTVRVSYLIRERVAEQSELSF